MVVTKELKQMLVDEDEYIRHCVDESIRIGCPLLPESIQKLRSGYSIKQSLDLAIMRFDNGLDPIFGTPVNLAETNAAQVTKMADDDDYNLTEEDRFIVASLLYQISRISRSILPPGGHHGGIFISGDAIRKLALKIWPNGFSGPISSR